MSAKRFHNPLHKSLRLQQQQPPAAVQNQPRSMLNPGPSQKSNQAGRPPQGAPQQPVDPRRIIVEQIVRDCYSKFVVVNGQSVPEMKYNTHLNIREYSQYPQQPPPTDIPPSQIGSVKNRILAVCTKHSGRVLLQKGKYNDAKHVFQIGRTWDLDELQSITRVGTDAFILLLNKDYYWKSGEGPDRFLKFVHHLATIYSKFTGRYPQLQGFSAEELGLPPLKERSASTRGLSGDIHAQKVRTGLKLGPLGPPPPPAGIAQHYVNMDFTANGKLPLKPMIVMDVDRPGSKLSSLQDLRDTHDDRKVHPYSQISLVSQETRQDTLNDSHSFVFGADDSEQHPELMPTISEYAQATGRTLPMRQYKPEIPVEQVRNVSEPIESSAAYSEQLRSKLDGNGADESLNFQVKVPVGGADADFGIEEAEDASEESEPSHEIVVPVPNPVATKLVETSQYDQRSLSSDILEESTKIEPDSAIDNSIREIENFMDTEFGAARFSGASQTQDTFEDSKSTFSYDDRLVRNSVHTEVRSETPATEPESKPETKVENDAEVEELLDEIGWSLSDSSDLLVKKLSKELNEIKHKNIYELRFLDFGKDTLANEVSVAAGEVDNLVEVFKRMEISLHMIAPKIDDIESNSKGLQVLAVNKKILFNDLNEILNKVRVSPQALEMIATYDSFLDVETVEDLEGNLLILYDALGTIGSTTDEDLSSMKALKQFQDTYMAASTKFIEHFSRFMQQEFKLTIEELNDEVDTLYPRNLLQHIKNFLAYNGITNFVKGVSDKDLRAISDTINSCFSQFLDILLTSRLKGLSRESKNLTSPRLSDSMGLQKSRSGRFGSTRLINKLTASSDDRRKSHNSKLASSLSEGATPKSGNEVSDPKIILRMVHETNELIYVIQYFSGSFFHSTSILEYSDYVKAAPFLTRIRDLEDPELDLINYKTNSNDLLKSMTSIFGNYINRFIKKLTPAELITPQLLLELQRLIIDASLKHQDFINYSFLTKLVERYKSIWKRFIASQVDLLNKSDIRSKTGILPVVRNLNQIFLTTETSLQEATSHKDVGDALIEVNNLLKESYESLTHAAVDLFERDDPLLKSNSHDEKERAHRQVAILQNVYALLQELDELSTSNTAPVRNELTKVFNEIKGKYFGYLLHRKIGKMYDFVKTYSATDNSKRKKDDKILVRSLASTYTAKELQPKIVELHSKLTRNVVVFNNVDEQDLLKKLWGDLEAEYAGIFQKFDTIVKAGDRDVDSYASPAEIRRMFETVQSTRI